jgi:hypothetical protein
MLDCLNKKATQVGFADLVGCSKQAIHQRVNQGTLPKGGTYSEWLKVYIEGLRNEAAGRSDEDLGAIRGRKELAQARREEFQLAKDYKLVIITESLEPALIDLLKSVRSQVMETGSKVLQSIEMEHSITLDDNIVLGPLRAALGNIAGSADQLVSSITEEPCASVSAALAADKRVDRAKRKTAIRK